MVVFILNNSKLIDKRHKQIMIINRERNKQMIIIIAMLLTTF